MYKLYAASCLPGWSGQIASETFPTIEEAESKMREWARFGVDAYCNEPDSIWITDADEQPLKYWDWRSKSACEVGPETENGQ